MTKSKALLAAAAALSGVAIAAPLVPVHAQAKRAVPERQLLNIALGRGQMDVIKRYGVPQEIQNVSLETGGEQLPGLGGASGGTGGGGYPGGGGSPFGGGGGYPGGGGGYPGGGGTFGSPVLPDSPGPKFGGGSPFGGGGGGYPGGGGGYPGGGGGGYPGGGGGYPGGGGGGYPGGGSGIPALPPAGGFGDGGGSAASQGPEYANAVLWIYKRPGNIRLEFLINEDGRVAQISAAAPTDKPLKTVPPGIRTAHGVTLGSTYGQVLAAYGNPERYRMLPGGRFHEVYYTKNNHAAFTFDLKTMKVARITIALAD